ncbi:MAG: insulinase family protein [Bacteroidota bacterium]
MRLLHKCAVCFLLLLMISFAGAQSDSSRAGEVLVRKLINGLTAVAMPLPNAAGMELTFQIRCGSIYENDSVRGGANLLQHLLANRVSSALRNAQNKGSLQQTTFLSYTTHEHSIFKLNTTSANIPLCLSLMKEYLYDAYIREEELKQAVDSVLLEIERGINDPAFVFEDRMLKRLYEKDYDKMNPLANPDKLKDISIAYIRDFHLRYYVVNNTTVTATGNFLFIPFEMYLKQTFNAVPKSAYDPEEITNIVDIRPITFTSQFIVEDSVSAPEFHIFWQFPGTNSNNKASYIAHLLTTMLNDNDNFIQVKAAKMGCKKLVAQYEANNFASILRVIVQPARFFTTYNFVVKELMRLEKTLVNESMMNAGKVQFRKNYEILQQTKLFPEKVVHHTAYKDNKYYSLLIDSVMTIDEKSMNLFVLNYMSRSPHITGVKISSALKASLKLDSLFNDINESVGDYVFRYRQNITELEGDTNLMMQNNLLQWLRINSDVYLQVNGYSDESEYNKVRDDTILAFIDSVPTVRARLADMIEKKSFSPAMMRALRIVKFLYENGITADRLSGTGMKFTSDTDEAEIENMKCTLSLEKLMKRSIVRVRNR